MYYLKHGHECFIRYKTRGAAESFISDKARFAIHLIPKNDPFYTHYVTLFTLMVDNGQVLYKRKKSREKLCENLRMFYHI